MCQKWQQSAALWPLLFALVLQQQRARRNSVVTANNSKRSAERALRFSYINRVLYLR